MPPPHIYRDTYTYMDIHTYIHIYTSIHNLEHLAGFVRRSSILLAPPSRRQSTTSGCGAVAAVGTDGLAKVNLK